MQCKLLMCERYRYTGRRYSKNRPTEVVRTSVENGEKYAKTRTIYILLVLSAVGGHSHFWSVCDWHGLLMLLLYFFRFFSAFLISKNNTSGCLGRCVIKLYIWDWRCEICLFLLGRMVSRHHNTSLKVLLAIDHQTRIRIINQSQF